jgi:serine phosphatase RsbU (regulator of sigma subunit)
MKYIFSLTLFFISLLAYSEKIIHITEHSTYHEVTPYVYVLEDPKEQFSFEQVILSESDKFKLNPHKVLNFGFTYSVYWLKFSMYNSTNEIQNYVFTIQNPLIAYVDFIAFREDKIEKRVLTGEDFAFDSREIENRNFLFDLKLSPHTHYEYYIKVSSKGGPLQIPLSISRYDDYLKADNDELLLNGYFLGMFFFVILFNFFLLVINKNRLNLYYTIYVALLTIFLLNITGVNFQYLWPNQVLIQKYVTVWSAGLANIFLILFAQHFFTFSRFFRRINRLSNAIKIIGIMITVSSLFGQSGYRFSVFAINILSLVTIIFLTATSIRGLTRKNNMHYYFVFSFVFFLLGVGVYVMNNLGVVQQYQHAIWAMKLGFFAEILLLMFAVLHKYRIIEQNNSKDLEMQVKERTSELEKQKEELMSQKTEIIFQRDKILAQHRRALKQSSVISQKNKEINDSIAYARLIQNAVLPPKSRLDQSLNSYFILNQPKDVLGGDFFWFHERNQRNYIAVADCTGHGVPGAMLSMLGIAALNEIILKEEYLSPADILNRLSSIVTSSLHQNGMVGTSKDGMDISLCMIDSLTNTMLVAGSNNPVFIYREESAIEDSAHVDQAQFDDHYLLKIQTDKIAIGYNERKGTRFTDKRIGLQPNDMIYLFTDGYIDQFGGVDGKKFKRHRFRKLLSENALIQDSSMQHQHLTSHFQAWKKDQEQVDDIMVFGVRI